jgi:NTP pyrophosphohydrolases including oxidative damage repair enzymes
MPNIDITSGLDLIENIALKGMLIMYKKLMRKTVFKSSWIELFMDDVIDENNSLLKYNVVHFKNESVVVVVRKNNMFLMVDSYRYPIEMIQNEFPAGSIEDSETPFEAAEREVFEETGIKIACKDISYSFYPSNGITDQKIHVIFADYIGGTLTPQEEILKCYWITKDQLFNDVSLGKISDAPTLIALLYYNLNPALK